MKGAQSDELGHGGDETSLARFSSMIRQPAFVARPPAPARAGRGCRGIAVEAHELMRQYGAERLGISAMAAASASDGVFNLSAVCQSPSSSKNRRGLDSISGEAEFGIDRERARIDVEIADIHQGARILPAAEFEPRRNEGQLMREIAQGGLWQSLDRVSPSRRWARSLAMRR